MFAINILTSFHHLKAKFNKLIIALIMGAIVYYKQVEVIFPIEETIAR